MKLLLVTATAIAVFTVDCQDFSNELEGRDTDNRVQRFPEDYDGQGEGQNFSDGPDGNNLAENQDSDYDDQQLKEEKKEQLQSTLRRSKCKARNACVVMGGFCVTNATLCGGRLVPEGCKGTNCLCCVPGTLEAKLDQLEVTMNNIYSKMSSMMESQCKNKVTTSPVPPTITAPTATTTVTTSPVPPTITAATATTTAICSEAEGFFKVPNSTNHCYKAFTDRSLSWGDSKSLCQDEGLLLAKTDDPVALRKLLVETYGTKWAWIGARGTGSSMGNGTVEWDRDGTTISSTNSAWQSGYPGGYSTKSHCLILLVSESSMYWHPTQPYHMRVCHFTNAYPLCEAVME